MSTSLYLECWSHTPHIESNRVGQHLTDLDGIRSAIRHRDDIDKWSRCYTIGIYEPGSSIDGADELPRFLKEHKTCELHIIDEYGREHPVDPLTMTLIDETGRHTNITLPEEILSMLGPAMPGIQKIEVTIDRRNL